MVFEKNWVNGGNYTFQEEQDFLDDFLARDRHELQVYWPDSWKQNRFLMILLSSRLRGGLLPPWADGDQSEATRYSGSAANSQNVVFDQNTFYMPVGGAPGYIPPHRVNAALFNTAVFGDIDRLIFQKNCLYGGSMAIAAANGHHNNDSQIVDNIILAEISESGRLNLGTDSLLFNDCSSSCGGTIDGMVAHNNRFAASIPGFGGHLAGICDRDYYVAYNSDAECDQWRRTVRAAW